MNVKFQQVAVLCLLLVPSWVVASNDHGTGAPEAKSQGYMELMSVWWNWLGAFLPF